MRDITSGDKLLLKGIVGCLNNLKLSHGTVPQKLKLRQLDYVEAVWEKFIERQDVLLPWEKADTLAMTTLHVAMSHKTAAAIIKAMVDHLSYALAENLDSVHVLDRHTLVYYRGMFARSCESY
eukprot:SAG31_NODE_293_length_18292_cov_8.779586_3_plen_123_part_00